MADLNALFQTVANTESGGKERDANGNLITSPKGAEGKMQVMPTTNTNPGFGVKPAQDSTDAERTRVGQDYLTALIAHYDGDIAKGLAAYNYGPGNFDMALTRASRSDGNWLSQVPSETQNYVKKNLGALGALDGHAVNVAAINAGMTGKSFMALTPDELIYGDNHVTNQPKPIAAPVESPIQTPQREVDQGTEIAQLNQRNAQAVETMTANQQRATSFVDKVGAAWQTGPTFKVLDALDRAFTERDSNFAVPVEDAFKFAQDNSELNMLFGSQSQAEYSIAKQQIEHQRSLNQVAGIGGGVLSNGTDRLLVQLTSGVLDPLSLAAIVGTEGLGSMALGGQAGASIGRAALLGGVANMAVTGMVQASGEQTTPLDYITAAAQGAILGSLAGGHRGAEVADQFRAIRKQAEIQDAELTRQATVAVGPQASPSEITAKKVELAQNGVKQDLQDSLSNVPSSARLGPLSADEVLTSNPAIKADVTLRHNLDLVPEQGERDALAEVIAQAEQVNRATPTNKAGLTKVSGLVPGMEMEPTAMTLLKEDNEVANAFAKVVVENPTGAGGRNQTVALQQANLERWFNTDIIPLKNLYDEFRKQTGRGLVKEWYDPAAQREFNSRVWYELHTRDGGTPSLEDHPAVIKAADLYEASYQKMLDAQKSASTLGSDNLPANSKGYVPHRISQEKVVTMKRAQPAQYRAIAEIISKQFQDLNSYWQKIATKDQVEGGPTHKQVQFDKEFSDKLALSYLDHAVQKASGNYEMNMHIHDPENGSLLEDLLSKQMSREDVRTLLSQYQKGAAGFTKGRLKFNVFEQIPDGAGGSMRLGDLFEHDMQTLQQAYARRAAGEIALAHHGIFGRQGLETIRQAAIQTGISDRGLKAMNQAMAEILNESFGNHKQPFLQGLTVATGAARLGSSVFNQLGDYSAGVMALGVSRSIGAVAALPEMLKDIHEVKATGVSKNPILKTLDTYGVVGMDDFQFQRLLDQKDYNVQLYGRQNIGAIRKTIQGAANAQFIMTGHRALIAAQTRGMSQMIVRKAIEYIGNGAEDAALKDMGFNPRLTKAIKDNMDSIATFKAGRLQTLDLEAGKLTMADKMELRQVIDRGSSQIVQRVYPGEVGPWVHNDMLKMLYQFRSYSITAMNKQWSRNVMNYGHAKSFGALMGALSWAIPIQMVRVNAKTVGMDDTTRQAYLDRNLSPIALAHAAMNYTNAIGLGQDVFDVSAGMYAGLGGKQGQDFYKSVGQGSSNIKDQDFIGGVIAPPLGFVNDAWAGIHGNTHKLVHLIPGSNMMLVQPMINAFTADDK